MLCGLFIFSSVASVVRPILLGHDVRMPDYVVLIATLAGFELMGLNCFVIGPVIAAWLMAVGEIFTDTGGAGSPACRQNDLANHHRTTSHRLCDSRRGDPANSLAPSLAMHALPMARSEL